MVETLKWQQEECGKVKLKLQEKSLELKKESREEENIMRWFNMRKSNPYCNL